ncbi:MAG: hypothetical protein QM639_13185 [Rhodocyclaceae bacterium]
MIPACVQHPSLARRWTMRGLMLGLLCGAAITMVPARQARAAQPGAVRVAAGASPAHYQGVVGSEARDYVLGGGRGQVLSVVLHGHARVYFNVLAGNDGPTLYNGALDGAQVRLPLPDDGRYTVRVYQMGARSSGASYRLDIALNGPRLRPTAVAGEPVMPVADLIGMPDAAADMALENRGFRPAAIGAGNDHWWRAQSAQCVQVHIQDGRYSQLDAVAARECRS